MQADEQSPSTRSEKSPLLAFALSWLMPGCGQFYNGDVLKREIQRQQSKSAARVNPSHGNLLSANGLDATIVKVAFPLPF